MSVTIVTSPPATVTIAPVGVPSVVVSSAPRASVTISTQGVQGPGVPVPAGGDAGQVLAKVDAADFNMAWVTPSGGAGAQEVFVQPNTPSAAGPYLWIQTGLAPAGAGFTFWFEDGL